MSHTPNKHHVLVVRLEHRAKRNSIVRSYGITPLSRPEDDDTDREAAALLRRQGEQLDTLRAERKALLEAIGDPDMLRAIAVGDTDPRSTVPSICSTVLLRIAAAVPQDPEEAEHEQ